MANTLAEALALMLSGGPIPQRYPPIIQDREALIEVSNPESLEAALSRLLNKSSQTFIGPPAPQDKLSFLESWRSSPKPISAEDTALETYAGLLVPDAISTEMNYGSRNGFMSPSDDVNPIIRAMPNGLGRAAYFAAASVGLAKLEDKLAKIHPLLPKVMRGYVAGLEHQMLKDNKASQQWIK